MDEFDEDVWKMFEQLGETERHFNQMQHQYRALASGWVLAMFAGAQYVLSSWNKLPLPSEALLLAIGLAGAVGITQLWNLDVGVYHQLLDAAFVQGLRLEEKHPWLPRLRTSMLATQVPGPESRGGKGVLHKIVWFYVVGNTAALLVAAAGGLLWARAAGSSGWVVAVLAVEMAIIVIWGWLFYHETRSPLLEGWRAEQGRR
jgi:hypothetical protein